MLVLPSTGKWVVLDSDTPKLNKLTVIGVLEIPDSPISSATKTSRSAPVYSTVVIDAIYISIQVGAVHNLSLHLK